MDEMMENYAQFENEKNKTSWCPLLQKLKREICNNKQRAFQEIDDTIDFTSVVFEGITVLYDGNSHSIFVANLSDDFTVSYEGNGVKEVGTHTVIAKRFDKDNNLVHELSAKIIITQSTDVELPLV